MSHETVHVAITARQCHVGRSIAIEVSGEARHARAQCAMINTIRSERPGGIDDASALKRPGAQAESMMVNWLGSLDS